MMSTLSSEACVLRWLIRSYVARNLHAKNMNIPASLIDDGNPLTFGERSVSPGKLKEAFNNAVDMFTHHHGSAVQSLVDALPATVSAIEECVMEANRSVLSYGDVTWGRMVAVAAFINAIALRYVENEMDGVIVPLIEHTATLTDQKLAVFIRENGSWPVFEHTFKTKQRSWLYSRLTAVANYVRSFAQEYH
jgi:hypothetical protein